MNLDEWIELHYPKIKAAYLRDTTPDYYTEGVLYHPITSGFGCGSEGSDEPLLITKIAPYKEGGDIFVTFESQRNKGNRYSSKQSELYRKVKRLEI